MSISLHKTGAAACQACLSRCAKLSIHTRQPGMGALLSLPRKALQNLNRPHSVTASATATRTQSRADPRSKHFWTKDEVPPLDGKVIEVCLNLTILVLFAGSPPLVCPYSVQGMTPGVSGNWKQQWNGLVLCQDAGREWRSRHHGSTEPGAHAESCADDKGGAHLYSCTSAPVGILRPVVLWPNAFAILVRKAHCRTECVIGLCLVIL